MGKKTILHIIIYSLGLILLASFAAAANCGGTTPCNCGDTLTSSRTLNASDNLKNCTAQYALDITADNVVLDCAGYQITGLSTTTSIYGVNIFNKNNITIKNCDISGFLQQIQAYAFNSVFHNNTLHDSVSPQSYTSMGIHISGVTNCNVTNNTIYNITAGPTAEGIGLSGTVSNNLIKGNNVSASEYGIYIWNGGGGSTIIDNILTGNNIINLSGSNPSCGIKITRDSNSRIINNTINGNIYGICTKKTIPSYVINNINITGNNITANTDGLNFYNETGLNVWHNNIHSNTRYQANSGLPIELSYNNQGNWWGRTTCKLFIPGTDSNNVNVVDSYPYNASNSWNTGGSPFVCPVTCGETITSSTSLTTDITGCSGNGLIIGASNVVLDCAGHSITGNRNAQTAIAGVKVQEGYGNITIKNCNITDFTGDSRPTRGIWIDSSSDVFTIDNNTISECFYGIEAGKSGTDRTTITNNKILNTFGNATSWPYSGPGNSGIEVVGNHNLVKNNTILQAGLGIFVSYAGNTTIIDNYIDNMTDNIWGSTGNGIIVNFGSGTVQVINNTAKNCDLNGILIESSKTGAVNITGNNITNNIQQGLNLKQQTNKNVWHNNIYNNNGGLGNEQVTSTGAIELSYNNKGNWWGRTTCKLFIPGTDSNNVNVVDSYPYNASNSWNTGGSPVICPATCGDTITSSTSLTTDLIGCTADGLIINGDDITLDCQGHSIIGQNSANYCGINITPGSDRVTIKNCSINTFKYGIVNDDPLGDSGDNLTIQNNTIQFVNKAVYSKNVQNWVKIINNTIKSGTSADQYALYLQSSSSGDIIENNTIASFNNGMSIWHTTNIIVRNNKITGMQYSGSKGLIFRNVTYSVIDNNIMTGTSTSGAGVYLYDGSHHNNITSNTVTKNGNGGIWLSSGSDSNNKIWHNNIYNNTGFQLSMSPYANNVLYVNSEGNYWGRNSCPAFIAGTDTLESQNVDNFPYTSLNGWLTESPTLCCGGAVACTCGAIVYQDTTLTGNLNCAGDALTIVAGNISLDCNNYAITGNGSGTAISATNYSDLTISNCVISNFSAGIGLLNSNDSAIEYNTITYLSNEGVYARNTGSLAVRNNSINNADDGIYVYDSVGPLITGNTIHTVHDGIYLLQTSNGTVEFNTVSNLTGSTAISIIDSNYNAINDNTIGCTNPATTYEGIKLVSSMRPTENNQLFGNEVHNCDKAFIADGIDYFSADNENYYDNVYGMYLFDVGYDENNMPIINNSDMHDNDHGIYLSSTSIARIENTDFTNNQATTSGLHLTPDSTAYLTNGDFINNTDYAIFDGGTQSVFWLLTKNSYCTNNNVLIDDGWIIPLGGKLIRNNCNINIEGTDFVDGQIGYYSESIETSENNTYTFGGPDYGVEGELHTTDGYEGNLIVQFFDENPGGSGFFLAALGLWINATITPDISGLLDYWILKIYYTDELLAAAGLTEASLKIEFYNETSGTWYIEPNQGVDTINNYVWAQLTHFSTYGVYGSKPKAPSGGGGGGGAASSKYECNDFKDNDGDGLIDYPSDPGCTSIYDLTEADEKTTLTNCQERWVCTEWTECINGIQTRSCEEVNKCGTSLYKEPTITDCTPEIPGPVKELPQAQQPQGTQPGAGLEQPPQETTQPVTTEINTIQQKQKWTKTAIGAGLIIAIVVLFGLISLRKR